MIKKIILFFLLIIPLFCSAQLKDSVKVKTSIFEIIYSETLESPLHVKYNVTCTNGLISRSGMNFHTDSIVHTSDDKDYADNRFDKGHMAPAADFNCSKETLEMTFTYLNCALQDQGLNRLTWRLLESKERELAKKYTVTVEITVDVNKKCEKLPTGAYVPKGFYKTIYIKETKQVLKYYMPNIKPVYSDPEKYRIK